MHTRAVTRDTQAQTHTDTHTHTHRHRQTRHNRTWLIAPDALKSIMPRATLPWSGALTMYCTRRSEEKRGGTRRSEEERGGGACDVFVSGFLAGEFPKSKKEITGARVVAVTYHVAKGSGHDDDERRKQSLQLTKALKREEEGGEGE